MMLMNPTGAFAPVARVFALGTDSFDVFPDGRGHTAS
jgi:hypothetical protein